MYLLFLVTFLDGSTVNLKIPDTCTFSFQTAHGKLAIPLRDIRECNVGVHVRDQLHYETMAKDLGSEAYGHRDTAMKFFRANPRGAYRWINPLKNSEVPEVAKRVDALLKEYNGFFPVIEDRIGLKNGYLSGTVLNPVVEGESESLGKLSIHLCNVKSLQARMKTSKVTLQAGEPWIEVGYVVDGKIKIAATGEVDLWPATPGQHVCNPNGISQTISEFPAGGLIGRIGAKTFFVGSGFSASNLDRGKLELRINGSPWPGSTPTGSYEVTVE